MNNNIKPLFEINFSTILISTAAVMAKLISLPAQYLIFLRCVFAVVFLFLIMKVFQESFRINIKRHAGFFLLSGVLMAGHWVTYFLAIQVSNVAVAVIAIFTHPVLTTLLEPVFFKSRIEMRNVFFSLIVMVGIFIIMPTYDLRNDITMGFYLGFISAWMYSLRNILSKKYITVYSGYTIMFYQMIIAMIVLIPFGIRYFEPIGKQNLMYLVFLGLVSTAIGHAFFVRSLKYYSASTVSIISTMLPVYAILWAYLILDEQPGNNIILGGIVILGVVLTQNVMRYKKT